MLSPSASPCPQDVSSADKPADQKSINIPTSSADISAGSTTMFPPGTVRLEDMSTGASDGIILQPRPTDDPNDPLNWPSWRKYVNFALVGFYVVMVSEFINSATPTWRPMQKELGFSDEDLTASYAIGCAFLAVGAVVLVPFALKFGRRPLYVASSLVQFGVSIWSAKIHTVADLLLVNVFIATFGALGEVLVQMTIADVFFVHQRGRLNSLYIWLWQVSVSLGPLIAGFITKGQGWRWVWWWNAIFFALFFLVALFGYEETRYIYPSATSTTHAGSALHEEQDIASEGAKTWEPVAAALSSTTAKDVRNKDLYSVRINPDIPTKTYWQKLALTTPASDGKGIKSFLRHMYQPLILLVTIPAIMYTALAYGILIALQDVMSTAFSLFMTRPPYNFTPSQIGMMNLSKLVGSTIGSLLVGPISDGVIIWLSRRNNGIYEPEMRLWSLVPFLPFIPAGALMLGFGLNNGLPWPVVAVGLALYKLGIAPVNSITITYLTDSYQDIIGDALVGVTVIRNTFSTAFIFAVAPWVAAVGIKWVIITIVLITTAILGSTGIFLRYGKAFRARSASRYAHYATLQYKER